MGVEIVLDDVDLFCPRVAPGKRSHELGVVLFCAPPTYAKQSKTPERLNRHENRAATVSLVLGIFFADPARLTRQWADNITDELAGALIDADNGLFNTIGSFIQIENIFHAGKKLPIDGRQTPRFREPRLNVVFFNRSQTALWVIESTSSNATISSASIRIVHRTLPSGGVEQAIATNFASTLPKIFGGRPGRGLSCTTASPSVWNRRQMLLTATALKARAAAI